MEGANNMNIQADNLNANLTPLQMLVVENICGELKKKIFIFLSLCQDLKSVLICENSHLMNEECVLFDEIFYHKLQLLTRFEHSIPPLFKCVKEEAIKNMALQIMLMEEMKEVKSILNINTAFHMNELKFQTQKINNLRENIVARAMEEKSGTVCH